MSIRHLCLLFAATLLALPAAHAQAPLNDTGQVRCYDASNTEQSCDEATTGNTGERPRQDGRFGRDARATDGTLNKTGGGAAGFDFTKLDEAGLPLAIQNDAWDSSGSEAAGTQWSCVKDNVTGLVWSTETIQGVDWATATGTAADSYNSANRCGTTTGTDFWRAPTRRELLSIVHYGKASAPLIDENYFPNTNISLPYWTSDEDASGSTGAWVVYFYNGGTNAGNKGDTGYRVRLVRGGQ